MTLIKDGAVISGRRGTTRPTPEWGKAVSYSRLSDRVEGSAQVSEKLVDALLNLIAFETGNEAFGPGQHRDRMR